MADREQDFPAEKATRSFTELGQALEAYNLALGAHLDAVDRSSQSIESANTRREADAPKGTEVDPIEEQYRSARAQHAKEEAEFQQITAILGQTIGVTSPGAEAAKASTEIARTRSQIVDVQYAFDKGLIDLNETEKELKRLNRQLALAEGKQAINTSEGGGSRWGKLVRGAVPGMVASTKKGMSAVAGQVGGVGKGLMGKLGGALPVAGGLAIFGLMLWGFKEADRMRAEFGEITNIAVAAGGNAQSRGLAWMAGFQERAQKFYGISRKEVQGVFKNFVNAGISMDDMFRTIDKGLGEAGANAIALSVAADRHFELSTGATSKAATQAVTHYGMNLGEAVDTMTTVQFAARRAGFGVGSLVTWTLSATANVRHLGVGIEEVAFAALRMRKFYEKAGVDSQTAAKDSVSQMLQGFQSMNLGRQFWAAEQLGLGEGVKGRNSLMEGLYRKDPQMLQKLASIRRKEAIEAGGGDETVARFFLEKEGFGHEGAKAVMELGGEADEEGHVHKKKKEDRRKLTNAFKEEGMKVSDLKKKMNAMLAGFAKMGQGMMQMLTGFMALVVVTVKGLPYYFMGTKEEAAGALAMMQKQIGVISFGAVQVMLGGMQAGDAIWSIMKPMISPMVEAWMFNPYIAHLTKDELAAFEDDPDALNSRMGKISAVAAKYGMLRGEAGAANFRRIYGVGAHGEDLLQPTDPPALPKPPTPPPKPPPKPGKSGAPAGGDEGGELSIPVSTPAPKTPKMIPMGPSGGKIQMNLGGETIILGANDDRHKVEIRWEGDPNDPNLVADVTTVHYG